MSQLLYSVALLACPVGMGLMMWTMMRGGNHGAGNKDPQQALPQGDEITRLRAEVDQLRAETRARAGDHTTVTGQPR